MYKDTDFQRGYMKGQSRLFKLLSPHSIFGKIAKHLTNTASHACSTVERAMKGDGTLPAYLSSSQLLLASSSRPSPHSLPHSPLLTSPEVGVPGKFTWSRTAGLSTQQRTPFLPSSSAARLLEVGLMHSHCISVIPVSSWNRKYGKAFTWWEALAREGWLFG